MGGPLRTLTDQHLLFVEYYLIHFVGARAARDAGWSVNNSRTQAWSLLRDPLIIAQIRKRTAEIMEEIKAEQLKIFRELMKIGHSKIRDLYHLDGSLKALEDWPEDIASCVSSIKQKITTVGKGKFEVVKRTLEVKLWNKNQALDILTKVTGLQTAELKLALPDNVGALYFPQPKPEGAPVDAKIVARDEKLRLTQGGKSGHDQKREQD